MRENGDLSDGRMLDRSRQRDAASLWSSESSGGMVASAHYRATAVGAEVLRRGGNAVDAAVATSLALAVCEPAGSGLGGMALMLIHLAGPGRTLTVEGPCRAPALATPETITASRRLGYGAVAVPTFVAVLERALRRYGKWSAPEVLAFAVEMAERGCPLTRLQHVLLQTHRRKLRRSPPAAERFLDAAGKARGPGEIVRHPALARTLRRMSAVGLEDFYSGQIAREICDDMRQHGGWLREPDLTQPNLVRERSPIFATFHGDRIATLGPPTAGWALLRMLGLTEALADELPDVDTWSGLVQVAAVIRRVRRNRRAYRLKVGSDDLGQARELLAADRIRADARAVLAGLSSPHAASAFAGMGSDPSSETSHLCVLDAEGNAVSLSQSLERSFGSGAMTRSLGFLYNGYMDAFKVQNSRHPHYLRPGAVARSNVSPTLVIRAGQPWVALGSSGSERIPSIILQVLLRLSRQTPFEAVHAPRLHCTPGGHVVWEGERFPDASRRALHAHGFSVEDLDPYAFQMGALQLVCRNGGRVCGVADPRRDGAAFGPDMRTEA